MQQRAFCEEEVKKNPGLWEKVKEVFRRIVEDIKKKLEQLAKKDLVVKAAMEAKIYDVQAAVNLLEGAMRVAKEQATANEEGRSDGETEKHSYAGIGSRTADRTMLQMAEEMLEHGASDEEIRKKTGWFRGMDGLWRYEIDDSKIRLATDGTLMRNPDIRRYNQLMQKFLYDMPTVEEIAELREIEPNVKGAKMKPEVLGDMLEHNALFEAYPALMNMKVRFGEFADKSGSYDPGTKTISLDRELLRDLNRMKKVLIHEIQHAIQDMEGFSSGSNEFFWATKYSETELQKIAEREIAAILKDVPKDLQNKYYRYQDLESVLSDLFLQDGKEAEYAKYEGMQDDLYAELYHFDWFRRLLDTERMKGGGAYFELYQRTAGEIEARDVADRVDLTAEERKEKRPDIDRADVVFADVSGVSFSEEYDKENVPNNAIYPDMAEEDRADVLEKTVFLIKKIDSKTERNRDYSSFNTKARSQVEKQMIHLLREVGILDKKLTFPDLDFDFEYSTGKMRESFFIQNANGESFVDFAMLLDHFDEVLDSARPIEVHSDIYKGTIREDTDLEKTFILLSGFETENSFIPVELIIKRFISKTNRLHATVTIGRQEKNSINEATAEIDQHYTPPLFSEYSIRQIVEKINPKFGDFLKYIPDRFLNEAQIRAKKVNLEKESVKIENLRRGIRQQEERNSRVLGAEAAEYAEDVKVGNSLNRARIDLLEEMAKDIGVYDEDFAEMTAGQARSLARKYNLSGNETHVKKIAAKLLEIRRAGRVLGSKTPISFREARFPCCNF